jgi:ribonucleoside-triphosphate reductase
MTNKVVKRNGDVVEFDFSKISTAVKKAYKSCGKPINEDVLNHIQQAIELKLKKSKRLAVEEIQNLVEFEIGKVDFDVAKAYVIYRYEHQQAREINDRISYMNKYKESSENAATSSETDANANVTQKNVANLEGEVYKTFNRIIQRQRMNS